MATQLTPEQQQDVDDYVREIRRLQYLSEQETDPTLKQEYANEARNYPHNLRISHMVPKVIIDAVEKRLGVQSAAPPAKPASTPEGGRKYRKTKKQKTNKKRATRKKIAIKYK